MKITLIFRHFQVESFEVMKKIKHINKIQVYLFFIHL